ncbi:DUF397 domain-containing protein [Embleya sp. NBC_00896]|uniref:DUF397 domain-containing protein n=1 Tax=Embleya sp. NBC_00896 TaxID=2975961 RepID=UPI0038695D95|nr:DUF397 domain-containing protein [Embleya sp. NBC_00896]
MGRAVTRSIDHYPWRKATRSNSNQACVEVAPLATATGIRDTKDRRRGHVEIAPAAWVALLGALKR